MYRKHEHASRKQPKRILHVWSMSTVHGDESNIKNTGICSTAEHADAIERNFQFDPFGGTISAIDQARATVRNPIEKATPKKARLKFHNLSV